MSDPPPPTTVAGAAAHIASSLPAQFLALVVLNAAFLAGLLWFLDRENAQRLGVERELIEARERMLGPLAEACRDALTDHAKAPR